MSDDKKPSNNDPILVTMKELFETIRSLGERMTEMDIRVDRRLNSIDRTMLKQENNLEKHMYRTELAEKNIETLRNDIKPIKRHVFVLEAVLKLLGILIVGASTVAGLTWTIIQIISWFQS